MGRLSDCSHYMARECKTMVQRCLPVKAINCHLAVARSPFACRPLTAACTKCGVTLDEPPHPPCLIIRLLIACARCHSVSASPLPSPFSFLFSPSSGERCQIVSTFSLPHPPLPFPLLPTLRLRLFFPFLSQSQCLSSVTSSDCAWGNSGPVLRHVKTLVHRL